MKENKAYEQARKEQKRLYLMITLSIIGILILIMGVYPLANTGREEEKSNREMVEVDLGQEAEVSDGEEENIETEFPNEELEIQQQDVQAAQYNDIVPFADPLQVSEVGTWAELKTAMESPEVDVVRLINDIKREGGTATTNIVVSRSKVLEGNQKKLTIESGGTSSGRTAFGMAAVTGAAVIEIYDLEVQKTNDTSYGLVNQVNASASTNWTVKLHNVKSAEANTAALVTMENSDVYLTGNNNLKTTANATIITAANLKIEPGQAAGSSLTVTKTGTGVAFSVKNKITVDPGISIAVDRNSNGVVFGAIDMEIGEQAVMNISRSGTGSLFSLSNNLKINKNVKIEVISNGAGSIIETKNLEISEGADIDLTGTGACNAGIYINGAGNILLAENSKLRVDTSQGTGSASSNDGASDPCGIYGEISSFTMERNSQAEISAKAVAFRTTVDSSFTMREGAVCDIYSAVKGGLCLNYNYGNNNGNNVSHVLIEGAGTKLNVRTDNNVDDNNGAAVFLQGAGSTLTVTDHAEMNVAADPETTTGVNNNAMMIQGDNAKILVEDGSKLNLVSGEANGFHNPVLRFRYVGGMTLEIDDAEVNIISKGGQSDGIRLYGGNNNVYVTNGGSLYIENPGDGTPRNGATSTSTANMGLHYTAGASASDEPNSFIVSGQNEEGKSSSVVINCGSGAAIQSDRAPNTISVSDNAVFEAIGKTAGGSRESVGTGIFNSTSDLQLVIDNPAFFDFVNYCDRTTALVGGPVITTSGTGSQFIGTNTTLSVWDRTGDPNLLEGNPSNTWKKLYYFTFSGANMGTLNSVSHPEEFENNQFSNVTNYARISSNNARAIVDELRVPTDADKRIYGHVSMPEGRGDDKRNAWDDEVIVLVDMKDEGGNSILPRNGDGSTKYLKGYTVGATEEDTGLWPFEQDYEEHRGGLFEIRIDHLFPDSSGYIPENYSVEVIGAWRGNEAESLEEAMTDDRNVISTAEDIQVSKVSARHVVPPRALTADDLTYGEGVYDDLDEFDGAVVTTRAKVIKGKTTDLEVVANYEDAIVYIYINDEVKAQAGVAADGSWSADLSGITLEEGQKLGVVINDGGYRSVVSEGDLAELDYTFLKAHTLRNNGNEKPRLDSGNSNTTDGKLAFHDKVFHPRLELDVVYYGTLELVAPDKISFGRQSISPFKQQYRVMEMYQNNQKIEKFGVQDTRVVRDTWHLYVKMDQEMTHTGDTNLRLLNALTYVRNGTEHILNKDVEELAVQELNPDDELYDVYGNKWYDATEQKDGLYLNVRPGAAKAGSYTGSLTWILKDVP